MDAVSKPEGTVDGCTHIYRRLQQTNSIYSHHDYCCSLALKWIILVCKFIKLWSGSIYCIYSLKETMLAPFKDLR